MQDVFDLLGSSLAERFEYAEKITDTKKKNINRESIQDNLKIWLTLWRDFYICASGSDMPLTYVNFKSLSQKTAKKLTEPVIYAQLLQLENSLQQLDVNLSDQHRHHWQAHQALEHPESHPVRFHSYHP